MHFQYYQELAVRTLSNSFYPRSVDERELVHSLRQVVAYSNILDNMKKRFFYGKDQEMEAINPCPSLPPKEAELFHGLLGIITEAGEIASALLTFIHSGDFDLINLEEEIGDLLWYQAVACSSMKTTLDVPAALNIKKLRKRYGEKFSEASALSRDPEGERTLMEQYLQDNPGADPVGGAG